MEQVDISRLNELFEKMVANRINIREQRELSQLYDEFVNEGREDVPSVVPFSVARRAEKRVG